MAVVAGERLADSRALIQAVHAAAYRIPTDKPEADGTLSWEATTLVTVHVEGGGCKGFGYTYSSAAIVELIEGKLAQAIHGKDALDVPACWQAMQHSIRNLGRAGLVANAISALDAALWDLKGRVLERPVAQLLGRCRETVPIYGSGGFTSYSDEELRAQLGGWVQREGCRWVKMKVGSQPERDPHRVQVAKGAIGEHTLFVDANGAYHGKQALQLAQRFHEQQVGWFEEPVSSDDLTGLRQVRERAPAGMEVAAGEYGYTVDYFEHMLAAEAVDVLQADLTRCGGVTGFMRVGALCEAHHRDLSAHCAPALHVHAACAVPRLRHQEWFHDHVRIEQLLLDGAPRAKNGRIAPDLSRPGLGLELKQSDAERYRL